jgi:hypothetical protein
LTLVEQFVDDAFFCAVFQVFKSVLHGHDWSATSESEMRSKNEPEQQGNLSHDTQDWPIFPSTIC